MPDVIQGLWIGRPLSPIERLSLASFLANGHEYHLYCYDEVANVPAGVVIRDGNEILPASEIFSYQQGPGRGSVAAFSDLFRHKLLLERGGWWVDTDTVCLRPFDFTEAVVLASEHARPGVKVTSALIKLPRGHPIASRSWEVARKVDRASLQWGEIGPDLVTRAVVESDSRHLVMKPEVFCPIPWWEWSAIIAEDPGLAESRVTDQSYSIHLWHELWRRAGIAEAAAFPANSLFARLLQRYGVE